MLIHISKLSDVLTDKEEAQLLKLSKNQLRYLSRKCCALCGHPLSRKGCGTSYDDDPCAESIRVERRANCLDKYKPKKSEEDKC